MSKPQSFLIAFALLLSINTLAQTSCFPTPHHHCECPDDWKEANWGCKPPPPPPKSLAWQMHMRYCCCCRKYYFETDYEDKEIHCVQD